MTFLKYSICELPDVSIYFFKHKVFLLHFVCYLSTNLSNGKVTLMSIIHVILYISIVNFTHWVNFYFHIGLIKIYIFKIVKQLICYTDLS